MKEEPKEMTPAQEQMAKIHAEMTTALDKATDAGADLTKMVLHYGDAATLEIELGKDFSTFVSICEAGVEPAVKEDGAIYYTSLEFGCMSTLSRVLLADKLLKSVFADVELAAKHMSIGKLLGFAKKEDIEDMAAVVDATNAVIGHNNDYKDAMTNLLVLLAYDKKIVREDKPRDAAARAKDIISKLSDPSLPN